jgi:hypothetical protein
MKCRPDLSLWAMGGTSPIACLASPVWTRMLWSAVLKSVPGKDQPSKERRPATPRVDYPDAAVMRALYDEHAAALWRYAMRLTGDRARADDVMQETLLRAWQHPEVADKTMTPPASRSPRPRPAPSSRPWRDSPPVEYECCSPTSRFPNADSTVTNAAPGDVVSEGRFSFE